MKIRIFRKQCFLSLIGIVISFLTAYIFIINSEWGLLAFNCFISAVLFFIIIGYYQVIVFEKDRIALITNLITKRYYSYNDIAFVYIATIIINNAKTAKWIILCQKGQENNRINYLELLLPIKERSFVSFKYSKKREQIVKKLFEETRIVTVDNDTGRIETE